MAQILAIVAGTAQTTKTTCFAVSYVGASASARRTAGAIVADAKVEAARLNRILGAAASEATLPEAVVEGAFPFPFGANLRAYSAFAICPML